MTRAASATATTAMWLCAAALAFACTGFTLSASAKEFREEEVTAFLTRLIAERTQDGVFTLHDPGSGQALALVFDNIRVVRGLQGFGWFPDVVFHDKDVPKKKYTVDFWLKPDGDELRLMDARVHKDAKPDGTSWMMITRSPLLWWWLPTLKRASAVTGVQAWQVMGAIHTHIVDSQQGGAYPLAIADGKTVPAELVAIYQPVGRSKEDGRYFACAKLRNKGTAAAAYSVDFWLDPDAGSVSVGTARPLEDPRADGGEAASEPHCRFEDLAFDVVE